ncbi:MAG: stage III sporulation protein AB [Hyphomonadaceae bacterium]|nr:stage III sporulation protein AB [Clostridia bacterium]
MFLKIIGSVLVLWSCSTMGFYFAHRFQKRVQALKAFQTMLQLLETEITYSMDDLSAILKRIAKGLPREVVHFLLMVEGNLRQSASVAWQYSLDRCATKMGITSQDEGILSSFGTNLGTNDLDGQLHNIAHFRTNLEAALQEATALYEKNNKLSKSMGLLGGLFAVLILL